jgi:quercetin dioxygenase-like cupin family protein
MLRFLLASCCCFAAVESKTVIDNDAVKILSVTYQPHDKSALHTHAGNRVVVLLDAGHLATIYEDGRRDDKPWQAGEARWVAAGPKHIGENTGSNPVRIIEVELKKPGRPVTRDPKLDPVAIDPKHNTTLFENDQVRVFRCWREPGGTEMLHNHPGTGRVAILLTDLDVKIAEGKSVTEEHEKAGTALWSGPAQHQATNTGSKKFDMVIVEVK